MRLAIIIGILSVSISFSQIDSWAGMDFTRMSGGSDKAQLAVPKFKNTEEALAYGKTNRGNKDIVEALRQKRVEAAKMAMGFLDKADKEGTDHFDEALKWATISQFYREAMEAMGEDDRAMMVINDFKNKDEVYSFIEKHKGNEDIVKLLQAKQEALIVQWQDLVKITPLSETNLKKSRSIESQSSFISLALSFLEPLGAEFAVQVQQIGPAIKGQMINGTIYRFTHN